MRAPIQVRHPERSKSITQLQHTILTIKEDNIDRVLHADRMHALRGNNPQSAAFSQKPGSQQSDKTRNTAVSDGGLRRQHRSPGLVKDANRASASHSSYAFAARERLRWTRTPTMITNRTPATTRIVVTSGCI